MRVERAIFGVGMGSLRVNQFLGPSRKTGETPAFTKCVFNRSSQAARSSELRKKHLPHRPLYLRQIDQKFVDRIGGGLIRGPERHSAEFRSFDISTALWNIDPPPDPGGLLG